MTANNTKHLGNTSRSYYVSACDTPNVWSSDKSVLPHGTVKYAEDYMLLATTLYSTHKLVKPSPLVCYAPRANDKSLLNTGCIST